MGSFLPIQPAWAVLSEGPGQSRGCHPRLIAGVTGGLSKHECLRQDKLLPSLVWAVASTVFWVFCLFLLLLVFFLSSPDDPNI